MTQREQHEVSSIDEQALSSEVISYCAGALSKQNVHFLASDTVGLFLISRIMELAHAALVLSKTNAGAPVAMATLARAQLESAANLVSILKRKNGGEREEWATRFITFGEYRHVECIGLKDREKYRASLAVDEQANFDRRVAIHDQVQREIDASEKKQRFPTWNCRSITATIRETFDENTCKWWDLMCLIAHGDASMLHKSLTISSEGFMLHQRDYGEADNMMWLLRMSRLLHASTLMFLGRNEPIEPDEHAEGLCKRLGLKFAAGEVR